jgi:hypothetical protein
MSATTRVNGFDQYTTGVLRTVAQLKAVIVTVKGTSTAVDLQSLDDGADEAVEAIVRELQPLMYYTVSDSSGVIHMIVDGHAIDAATLQKRVRNIAGGLTLGGSTGESDNVSTVAIGTAITVS